EAIRKGGEVLVREGFVEPRYVDAMIKNVKELGPYIVIAPGIAMPHARPEDGVKKVCMSLVTLKEPVEFGNATNDPVRIVVSLGAADNTNHIKALSELSDFLDSKENIEKLLMCNNIKEVLELISL
ncbi:PTS sugar transporter subunit IIA, partial [Tepidanaerobacter syntrophicus]|uniref:PTS sugar transporter subunit IIA n=1 Tax=Tepidanaerobacter syntrophicus TaxID=224999 RepID=UPI001BD2C7CD